MDPMLDIARRFLRSEREAMSKIPQVTDTRADTADLYQPNICPEDIYKKIQEQINVLSREHSPATRAEPADPIQRFLWNTRDERAQEVLANVFYADPKIARRVCEIRSELVPEFIHYLAEEARRHWEIEKGGVPPGPEKEKLEELFKKHGYGIHETFPDAFELALIESPSFMHELAHRLEVALPFSLVLKKELEEIVRSREVRLRSDPDAKTARMIDELLRIRSRLARLEEDGNRDIIEKESTHVRDQKRELQNWIESRHERPRSDSNTRMANTEDDMLELHLRLSRVEEAGNQRVIHMEKKHIPGQEVSLPQGWVVEADALVQKSQQESAHEIFRFPPIQAEGMSLFGLALSGGGIRSATFNLGILQGLADLDLLRRLDYLSGVSGGSHIAAWLGAWIKREPEGIRRVQRWLSTLRSPMPDTDESHPIQFLRRFSNYLAPYKGLLSADTWSIFTIWLRNTILNQIVFVLLLGSMLTAPKLIFEIYSYNAWLTGPYGARAGALIILLTVALSVLIGLNLRHFDPNVQVRAERRRTPGLLWTQFGVQTTIVAGSIVVGSLASALLFYNRWEFLRTNRLIPFWLIPSWFIPFLAIMGGLWIMHFTSGAWHLFLSQRPGEIPSLGQRAKAIGAVMLISAVSALVGGVVLHQFERSLFARWAKAADIARMVVFGPALVFLVVALVMLLQIGLMGRNLPDNRREWWGRLAATLLIALGIWIAFSSCALWGPDFARYLASRKDTVGYGSPVLWLVITALGSKWGFSGETPPFVTDKDPADTSTLRRFLRTTPREWIALIAPCVYITGLGILLSFLLYAIPVWIRKNPPLGEALRAPYWDNMVHPFWLLPVLLPSMLILAAILAWRFDVNEFSMHSFYRNRLVRCFLGASRAQVRNPNPFTGFDSEDDMRLSLLRVDPPVPKDLSRAARPYRGPYPIFNTTLNLVAGKELAWQERKAASFVFTPLYCGYELIHGAAHGLTNYANFGYRPTMDCAEPNLLGPSLGTAMAVSGAAANPNMGYHYSPAVSFLMALFNARLGCWMGNPRHRTTWRQSSPACGLGYLVNELIGGTDDASRFVNLSDGGHFENLGIYELVRRHCMYIMVCDAEEDRPFSFEGLSNAIRKCRSDFGVDIRLDPNQLRPVPGTGEEQGRSRTHCAVGDIVYSAERIGKLIYIKTSLTGDEPGDVLGYKLGHSNFPHQSTFNQFFSESQFESYRALGQHICMTILQRATEYAADISEEKANRVTLDDDTAAVHHSDVNKKFLQDVFRSLRDVWYPPTAGMVALRERHRELYDQLIEMFHSSDRASLQAAAQTFFRTPGDTQGPFLAYSRMIELMHRVFQDLDLEIMADHPHNEGWMNIFRAWAADEHFREAWEAARDNYDNRFKTFYKRELELEPGALGRSPKSRAA